MTLKIEKVCVVIYNYDKQKAWKKQTQSGVENFFKEKHKKVLK